MSRSRRAAAETGVASLRQVVEQLAYTLRLAFERALDLGKQRTSVLLAMEGHRELPIALEHGVRAPQLRLALGKQAPALIERRHVLGQKRVAQPTTEYTLNSVEGTADVRNDTMP